MNNDSMHEEDFDTVHQAGARFEAKLAAVMGSCCSPPKSFEDLRTKHFAKCAEEELYSARQAMKAVKVKVKPETSLEIYGRMSEAKKAKSVKTAKSAAKKSVKQKKIKRLATYFGFGHLFREEVILDNVFIATISIYPLVHQTT
jgi:hypothetical protein